MKNIRKIALYMMLGFAVLGGLFIAGESMSNPGGLRGIVFTAAWLFPMVVGSWLAWRRPRIAFPLLLVWALGILGLLLWQAIAPDWWHTILNSDGPIISVAIFAVATPLAILGYTRRTRFVGLILVGMPILANLAAANTGDNSHAPIIRGGSTMASTLPAFIAGVLYLFASFADKREEPQDEK